MFPFQFMICGLSFATFVVTSDTPHFRLTLTLILLLTTISFKFAVNQSLPMISYLTYLVSGQVLIDDDGASFKCSVIRHGLVKCSGAARIRQLNYTAFSSGYHSLKLKKVNFEIYIADRKATTCI